MRTAPGPTSGGFAPLEPPPAAQSFAGPRQQRQGRAGRMVGGAVLLAILALALGGCLGVHLTTERATANGVSLEARHADRARSGDNAPLTLTIRASSPFGDAVRVLVSDRIVELYGQVTATPTPRASTSTPEGLLLTFDPPVGDELRVDLGNEVADDVRFWVDGDVAVVDAQAHPLVSVHLATFVLP